MDSKIAKKNSQPTLNQHFIAIKIDYRIPSKNQVILSNKYLQEGVFHKSGKVVPMFLGIQD